jgi:molecular chaperone GrpE
MKKDKALQNTEEDTISISDIEDQIKESVEIGSSPKESLNESETNKENNETTSISEESEFQKIIEDKDKEIQKLKDRYLRALADYENLSKRTTSERGKILKNANAALIIKFLDLADSFDKAKASFSTPSISLETVLEGYNAIENQFFSILKNEGIEKIDSIGKKFNPEFHEVVFVKPEPDIEEDIIIDEVQPGYLLNSSVIRPSKVIISKE